MGIAAELIREQQAEVHTKLFELRKIAHSLLKENLPEGRILFDDASEKLPNTISLHVPGVLADDLVVACDLAGVCISSGSACASGKPLASHVLLAYGFDELQAKEVIRISMPHTLSEEQVKRGVEVICQNAKRMLASRASQEQAA